MPVAPRCRSPPDHDSALRALDATETSDFYEIVVERHRKASTIVTSNREPAEWLTMMSPLTPTGRPAMLTDTSSGPMLVATR